MPDRTCRPPAGPPAAMAIRLAALAAIVAAAAGCAQVKQTAAEASAHLDRLFGTESKAEAQSATTQEAERLYRAGLAERERGAKKAAFAQFLEAAELGHGPAAYETGLAYKNGHGTARDLEAGAKWINTAAERGERRAQYLTGAA